jgi:hypothetical protein
MHELGHHWLVSRELTWRSAQGDRPAVLREDAFLDAIRNGTPLPDALILGRQSSEITRSHWSPYVQADGSIMDGIAYRRTTEGRLARWQAYVPTPLQLPPLSGLPGGIAFTSGYNDLDQLTMGSLPANEAYAADGGRIYGLKPRFAAPVDYHTGLCVEFAANDYIIFGFYREPWRIALERTGSRGFMRRELDLRGRFDFLDESKTLQLRVVRQAAQWDFQLCLGEDAAFASGGGWQTLFSINEPRPARAVGTCVKTFGPYMMLVESQFSDIKLRTGAGAVMEFPTEQLLRLPEWVAPAGGSAASRVLREGQALFVRPQVGTWARRDGTRLTLGVPYGSERLESLKLKGPYDHGLDRDGREVDRMPRLLIGAPAGDFSFAARVRVHRVIWGPAAGGAVLNPMQTLWGEELSIPVRELVLSDNTRLRQMPRAHTFKAAFMVVAKEPRQINDGMLRYVEALRRHCEIALLLFTKGKFRADTRL